MSDDRSTHFRQTLVLALAVAAVGVLLGVRQRRSDPALEPPF